MQISLSSSITEKPSYEEHYFKVFPVLFMKKSRECVWQIFLPIPPSMLPVDELMVDSVCVFCLQKFGEAAIRCNKINLSILCCADGCFVCANRMIDIEHIQSVRCLDCF